MKDTESLYAKITINIAAKTFLVSRFIEFDEICLLDL